jgi:hypothetical protein
VTGHHDSKNTRNFPPTQVRITGNPYRKPTAKKFISSTPHERRRAMTIERAKQRGHVC